MPNDHSSVSIGFSVSDPFNTTWEVKCTKGQTSIIMKIENQKNQLLKIL